MAQFVASRTLADALTAAQEMNRAAGMPTADRPMVDRLANALAIPTADPLAYDDADEDLDLPMLVQGDRLGAVVPAAPMQRVREGRAALVGFGLGLVLLVPIGVVMSGRLTEPAAPSDPSSALQVQSSLAPASFTDTAPQRNATMPAPASAVPKASETLMSVGAATLASTMAADARPDPAPAGGTLADAQAMIAKGEVEAARTLLKRLSADNNPLVLFHLAETFDPNMLAAWSTRGLVADADLARGLYQRCLALGHTQARQRLEALE
jgi:hypothetical protein